MRESRSRKVRSFFGSFNLMLILCTLLILSSFLGTLVPRKEPVYSSPWFTGLWLLLVLNLGVCSLNRFRKKGREKSKRRRFALIVLHSGLVLVLSGALIDSPRGMKEEEKVGKGPVSSVTIRIRAREVAEGKEGPNLGSYRLPLGKKVDIEEIGYSLKAVRFLPDFVRDKSGRAFSRSLEFNNPAVRLEVYKKARLDNVLWLFSQFPGFHVRKDSGFVFLLTGFKEREYFLFQGVRIPGVFLVYLGFAFLVLGSFSLLYPGGAGISSWNNAG